MASQSASAPSPELLARFAALVGEKYAIADAMAQAPYLTEMRGLYHGRSALVLRPGTPDEVAAILKLANDTLTPIVPQGGNTGLVGGQTPLAGEIVLSLTRLDRIREVDPISNTMICEAGVVLANAQAAAAAAERLFPLSLAAEGSCTIGGNLATNAGGTAVLAYGNARELVLGLEVVLADGRIWNGLKGLRKDNTGYDLKQLFLGSEGTLGIITAAVLKLFPKSRTSATALAALADVDAAIALLGLLREALGDRLTGFELISGECIALTRKQFPALPDPLPGYPWYVLAQADDPAADSPLAVQMEAALAAAVEQHVAG